jgi:hypothetical protein
MTELLLKARLKDQVREIEALQLHAQLLMISNTFTRTSAASTMAPQPMHGTAGTVNERTVSYRALTQTHPSPRHTHAT